MFRLSGEKYRDSWDVKTKMGIDLQAHRELYWNPGSLLAWEVQSPRRDLTVLVPRRALAPDWDFPNLAVIPPDLREILPEDFGLSNDEQETRGPEGFCPVVVPLCPGLYPDCTRDCLWPVLIAVPEDRPNRSAIRVPSFAFLLILPKVTFTLALEETTFSWILPKVLVTFCGAGDEPRFWRQNFNGPHLI